MRARRVARRAGRRAARRTTRRVMRRRRRRRILVGGMVLLAAGGTAAAIKMTQKDAQRVEQHTGVSVEELTEEELVAAMRDLGIKSIELDDGDQAVIADQYDYSLDNAPRPGPEAPAPAAAAAPLPPEPEPSYLDELERLADLRERGIISDDDFEAKKGQLLGL